MTLPLSHSFINALEPHRASLYTAALAPDGSPHAAEQRLLNAARTHFAAFAKGDLHDIPTALSNALNEAPTQASAPAPSTTPTPMPADLWARLAAAVQLEAARSAKDNALNPDSVLLRPDPLLAPKKAPARKPPGDLDSASPSHLLLIAVFALLVGVAATIYLMTRSTPVQGSQNPAHRPSTTTAESPTP